MRLKVLTDKKGVQRLYIIKSYYDDDRREHSLTVEKLGTADKIREQYGMDPIVWANQRLDELNRQEASDNEEILVKFDPSRLIDKDYQYESNIGYLFLQKIYYELGLDRISKDIKKRHDFEFDLNDILSRLIYGRILNPCSKRSTFEYSHTLLEQPKFDLHQVYRALDVLSSESDFIQAGLYQNSFSMGKRKTDVIYYDCTNFFFECEEQDDEGGLRRYGRSKENRPLPIVEMGMFIDHEGIPLAVSIHPGNTNEQVTMRPLEKKILQEYRLSKFIVCADAGLSSKANKRYNSVQDRAFVVTQSIKKLRSELKEWALSPEGWRLSGSKGSKDFSRTFNINEIDKEKYSDRIFFKERWVDQGSYEEKLIVTFSLKYKEYHENIRNSQISRAVKAIESGASRISKKNSNDYRRLIEKVSSTDDGEYATRHRYQLDQELIEDEKRYDGFYAVCSNLDDDVEEIVKVNKYRWKIEECFRIMKTDFEARPVYVSDEARIKAHFLTCYLALVVYRYLELKLDKKYTCDQIISTLKDMTVREIIGEGYIPSYTRTDITDDLHRVSGFRTDYNIISKKNMKNILKESKTDKKKKLNAK